MELDSALLTRASEALLRHEHKKAATRNDNALIEDYTKPILLQLQLTSPISKEVTRPVRIRIPHSLFDDESGSVCFFCRTDDKDAFEKIQSDGHIPGLKTVLTIKQVKRDYKAFVDRKKLLAAHTHFLCDPSVLTQLYNCLGNVFSARNKVPVPIRSCPISKVPTEAMRALNSTYMHLKGDNISIRMGHTGLTSTQIVDNIKAGLLYACEKLPDNWKCIHSLHLKSSDSAALPIYAKTKNDFVKYSKQLAGVKDTKPKGKAKSVPVAPVETKATSKPTKRTTVSKKSVKEQNSVEEEQQMDLVVTPEDKSADVKGKPAVTKKVTRGKKSTLTPILEDDTAQVASGKSQPTKRTRQTTDENEAEAEPIARRLRRGRSESK